MPDGHQLTVPAGFAVNVFADELQFARFMALAPNGDVFLSEPSTGGNAKITVLRDADHDGVAETRSTLRPGSTGRSASRSGRTTSTSATTTRSCDSRTRAARLPRQGSRRRSSTCRRATPRSMQDTATRLNIAAQPDARLQPLDAQRDLQSGRHEDVRHGRLGHQRHAGDRRAARRDQRVQPGRQRTSRVGERTPQSCRPRLLSRHRRRCGPRSTSATISATIWCPTTSRP